MNPAAKPTANQAQRVVAISLAVSGVGFLAAGLFLAATVGAVWGVLALVGIVDFFLAGMYATGRIGGTAGRPGQSTLGSLIASRSRREPERADSARETRSVDSAAGEGSGPDPRAGVDPDYNPYARED